MLPNGLGRICPSQRTARGHLLSIAVSDLFSRCDHGAELTTKDLIICVEQ